MGLIPIEASNSGIKMRKNDPNILEIEIAFSNFLNIYNLKKEEYAILLYNQLSIGRKYYIFPNRWFIPGPSVENIPKLMKLANAISPKELVELNTIGLKIQNIYWSARKAKEIPDFEFKLLEDEKELINDWIKNKSSDK